MFKKYANQSNETNMAEVFTNLALDRGGIFKATANKGFIIASQKIMRCYRVSDTEKVLFHDLVSMMGERGYAFYSQKYAAFLMGKKSTTSIKAGLNGLRQKGFIYWEMGGGDLGTNHYKLYDLSYNPYLILSEAVHYFANKVRNSFRNIVRYEIMNAAILEFVEPPKSQRNTSEDSYHRFIEHLKRNPHERDSYPLYMNLFAELCHAIIEKGGEIDSDWQLKFHNEFKSNFYKVVVTEPRCTMPMEFHEGFEWVDYDDMAFPIIVPKDTVKFNSPKMLDFRQELIENTRSVEVYIDSLTRSEFNEECRKRGIPLSYEEFQTDVNDMMTEAESTDAIFVYANPRKVLVTRLMNEVASGITKLD